MTNLKLRDNIITIIRENYKDMIDSCDENHFSHIKPLIDVYTNGIINDILNIEQTMAENVVECPYCGKIFRESLLNIIR